MTRLLHLLPVIVVIALVTAGLKVDERGAFWREFLKSGGSLLAGFVGLAIVVFVAGLLL